MTVGRVHFIDHGRSNDGLGDWHNVDLGATLTLSAGCKEGIYVLGRHEGAVAQERKDLNAGDGYVCVHRVRLTIPEVLTLSLPSI